MLRKHGLVATTLLVLLAGLVNSFTASAIPVPSLVRPVDWFCEGPSEPGYFPPLSVANRADWVNPNLATGSARLARPLFLPFWDHLGKGIAGDWEHVNSSYAGSSSISNSLHSPSLDWAPGSQTSTISQVFRPGLSDTIYYRIPGVNVTVCQVASRPKVEYRFETADSLISFFNQFNARELNLRMGLRGGEQLTPMATGGLAVTKIRHIRNPYVKFIYDTDGFVNDYLPAPVVFDANNNFVAAEFVKTGYDTFRLDTGLEHQLVSYPVRIRFGWARYLPEDVKDSFKLGWKQQTITHLQE